MQIWNAEQLLECVVHPHHFMCVGVVREDSGIYDFQYLAQVMVVRFTLAAYFLENAVDFIKRDPQGEQLRRGMAKGEMAGEISVPRGLGKLSNIAVCA